MSEKDPFHMSLYTSQKMISTKRPRHYLFQKEATGIKKRNISVKRNLEITVAIPNLRFPGKSLKPVGLNLRSFAPSSDNLFLARFLVSSGWAGGEKR